MEYTSSEYMMPRECEMCGSENLAIRVVWSSGTTRYVCLDCCYSRSIAKQENLKKRTNSSINHWAARIVKRYPFCTICGSKEGLEAHHIIPVSHSMKYAYADTNGITLCKNCHWLVHHKETEAE